MSILPGRVIVLRESAAFDERNQDRFEILDAGEVHFGAILGSGPALDFERRSTNRGAPEGEKLGREHAHGFDAGQCRQTFFELGENRHACRGCG